MANVFSSYKKAPKVILVATDEKVHAMFDGMTVGEIGQKYNVDPNTVDFTEKVWEDAVIVNLVMDIKGNTYSFPFSRGLSEKYEDGELTPEYLLDCEARVSTRKADNAAYLTIGKPGNITLGERKNVFATEDVEENA